MASWERRTVRVRRNVWVLKSPAHATDTANLIMTVDRAHETATRNGKSVGDVYVSSVDEEVHVWFEESGERHGGVESE